MSSVAEPITVAYPAYKPLPAVPAKLKASAQDFEAMVLSEMISPMFAGLKTDGPFGGGQGEEAFRGFLTQEYGKAIAARGGIGVADMLIRSLMVTQEMPHGQ